jgi:hypothetical protein
MRVEGTNELIGGYNPLDWHSPLEWVETFSSKIPWRAGSMMDRILGMI